MAKLYPLEVSAEEYSSDVNVEESQHISVNNNVSSEDFDMNSQRTLTRAAMIRARCKVAEWTDTLSQPREDVENDD